MRETHFREERRRATKSWSARGKRARQISIEDLGELATIHEGVYGVFVNRRLVAFSISGGLERKCGTTHGETFVVHFTPWEISRIDASTERELAEVFGARSPAEAVVVLFQHQLSHVLWGEDHGEEFLRNTRETFGRAVALVRSNLLDPSLLDLRPFPGHGCYSLWNNSCFLDTLLMAVFFCSSPNLREGIFVTDSFSGGYRGGPPGGEASGEWKLLVSKLQAELIANYVSLNRRVPKVRGVGVRRALAAIDPEMGEWEAYGAADAFATLASAFPSWTASVPFGLTGEGEIKDGTPKATHTFWEFLDSLENVEGKAQEMLWEAAGQRVLVFRNGGLPRITRLWESGQETALVKSFRGGVPRLEMASLTKRRAFGELMFGMRLNAVVLHSGALPGMEGGGHYTAYVNTQGGWRHYDGLTGSWSLLSGLPRKALEDSGCEKPELLVYCEEP